MKDFKKRLLSSSVGISLLCFLIPLAFHPVWRFVFIAALVLIVGMGLWEYYRFSALKGLQPSTSLGVAAGSGYVVSCFLQVSYPWAQMLPTLILILTLFAFFFVHFISSQQAIAKIAISSFGFFYVAVSLSGIIAITYFFPSASGQDGRWWLAYLLIVSKMSDVGGYFLGKAWGKTPLAPQISPNKTLEGALGGLLVSVGASLFLSYLSKRLSTPSLSLEWGQSLWLGALLGLFSQFGDLAESLLKRDAGIKDSNPYLPGLGGVLDTVDALQFTTPILLMFLRLRGGI